MNNKTIERVIASMLAIGFVLLVVLVALVFVVDSYPGPSGCGVLMQRCGGLD